MASAIHQHESAIGIHVTPPSWTSSHLPPHSIPSRLSQSTSFGFPASYIKLPPAIYFTYGIYIWYICIYISIIHMVCICFNAILWKQPTLSFSQCPQVCSLCLCFQISLFENQQKRKLQAPRMGRIVQGQCDEISHDKQFSLSQNFMKFYYQGILQIQLAYHFVELTWL